MLRCSCSETVTFDVAFPPVCVFINRATVALHAQYYMSLWKACCDPCWWSHFGPVVMRSFKDHLAYFRLLKCCAILPTHVQLSLPAFYFLVWTLTCCSKTSFINSCSHEKVLSPIRKNPKTTNPDFISHPNWWGDSSRSHFSGLAKCV